MSDGQNMVDRPLRSVFIGNIPYEVTEEKLKEIFSEAGPVVSMKLVFDRETGKPKGYGFCEYKDVETAMSAMRNLNGYEVNGRILRVDNAGAERHRMAEMGAAQNVGHNSITNGPRHEMHGNNNHNMHEFSSREMEGPPPPEKTPEVITKAVASLPPEQMFELMKQMKMCIQNNPSEARNMLLQNPQLAYALLQAQVVMKIIDPATALAMLHQDNSVTVGTLLPEGQTGTMMMGGGGGQGRSVGGGFGVPSHPAENPWIAAGAGVSAPLMPINPPGPFGPGPMGVPAQQQQVGGDMDFRQMDPRMRNQQQGGISQDMDLRDPRSSQVDRFPVDPRQQRDREMRDRDLRERDRDMRVERDIRMGMDRDRDLRSDRGGMRDSDLRERDRDLRDPRMQQNITPGMMTLDPRARARAEREQQQLLQQQQQQVASAVSSQAQASAASKLTSSLPAGFGPAGTDSEKAALIMQVLQLSDEQISMLPPEQRQSILVLKEQIAKSAGGNR